MSGLIWTWSVLCAVRISAACCSARCVGQHCHPNLTQRAARQVVWSKPSPQPDTTPLYVNIQYCIRGLINCYIRTCTSSSFSSSLPAPAASSSALSPLPPPLPPSPLPLPLSLLLPSLSPSPSSSLPSFSSPQTRHHPSDRPLLPHTGWCLPPQPQWSARGTSRDREDRNCEGLGQGTSHPVRGLQLLRWIGLPRYGEGVSAYRHMFYVWLHACVIIQMLHFMYTYIRMHVCMYILYIRMCAEQRFVRVCKCFSAPFVPVVLPLAVLQRAGQHWCLVML